MDGNLLIAILGVIVLILCGWIYVRFGQHSQALMNLGKPSRPKSPYETNAEYANRGPREDQ